jgi:iron complex outermembrane receptor protein
MNKSLFCLGCVIIFLVCPSIVAFAADEAGARADVGQPLVILPTITVTAQKRAENIQQVPSSVGMISSQEVEQRRITTFADLNKIVPNLKIGDAGPGTYTYFGIRGRINGSMDVDPTVTVLVDGVPYDDFFTISGLPLFDVERIEVLRGPQSTMYGINSAAGVINVVTKKPGNTPYMNLGAEVNGGYRSDMGGNIRGSVGAPLIQNKLAMGLSFVGDRTGGYVTNDFNDNSLGGSETFAGRLSTVFTPTDYFDATLNFGAYKVNTDSGFLTLPTTNSAATVIGQSKRKWKADYNEEGHGKINSVFGDLNLRLETPFADLYSISAIRKADQKFTTERDGTSYDGITYLTPLYAMNPLTTNMDGTLDNDSLSYSQEFRIQSLANSESPLEWLLGFSFYGFSRDSKGTVNYHAPWMGPMGQPNYVMMDNSIDGSSYAIFGQATYRLFEDKKLGVTLGLRQEWTERKVKIHDSNAISALGQDNFSTTDSMFLPKFGIDYRITPETMVYATVAKGWRTGGVTPNLYAASTVETATYDAETSWTYEVGTKTEWFDRRLLLNVAGFYTVYKDFQDEIVTNPLVGGYLSNSGKARISGIEIEGEGRITEDLTAIIDFGYLHAKYKDYKTYGADYSGNTIQGVPEFTLGASLQYNFLDGFYVRPGVHVVGKTYWDRANIQNQNSYVTLNLRAGYYGENFEVYAYGENLTNKYAFNYAAEGMWGSENYYGSPIRPLQIGMGFNINF